ncbi:hypothetical protein DFJ74DRAFT_701018 [Hyaloraphidium curvatum]|nr:hypothetical protein DFJ74DRAFT_701018 [Hyaloraphidium curvatum]
MLGEPLAFVLLTNAVVNIANWPLTWLYLAADKYGWRKDIRIWPNKYAADELVRETIPDIGTALVQNLLDQTLGFFLPYYVFKFTFGMDMLGPLPTWTTALFQFVGIHLLTDFLFFWMHRAFHENEWLWKNVHKWHHQYNYPNALAHYHFSRQELMIQRIFKDWPTLILFKPHFALWLVYQAYNEVLDIQIHCGYDHGWAWAGAWMGSRVSWHHYHHNQPGKGAYTLWCAWIDRLFGTARNYDTWLEASEARKGTDDGTVEKIMLEDDSGIVGKGGIYAKDAKAEKSE